jgi:hypothetical protein
MGNLYIERLESIEVDLSVVSDRLSIDIDLLMIAKSQFFSMLDGHSIQKKYHYLREFNFIRDKNNINLFYFEKERSSLIIGDEMSSFFEKGFGFSVLQTKEIIAYFVREYFGFRIINIFYSKYTLYE